MVEILCPHCEGELELDDDASGEFECPLCNGQFEWNLEEDEKSTTAKEAHQKMVDAVTQTDNRIVPSHGFNKMHPVAKVAVGAAVQAGVLGGEVKDILLLDSGGQYKLGTTDVTRTLSIGKAEKIQSLNYTLVLKSHIKLNNAIFPKGTSGAFLDYIARSELWKSGKDFAVIS